MFLSDSLKSVERKNNSLIEETRNIKIHLHFVHSFNIPDTFFTHTHKLATKRKHASWLHIIHESLAPKTWIDLFSSSRLISIFIPLHGPFAPPSHVKYRMFSVTKVIWSRRHLSLFPLISKFGDSKSISQIVTTATAKMMIITIHMKSMCFSIEWFEFSNVFASLMYHLYAPVTFNWNRIYQELILFEDRRRLITDHSLGLFISF